MTVPAIKEMTKEESDYNLIMKKFGIQEDAFKQGIVFAQYVVDGMSRKKAYELTFEVDADKAVANSSGYFKRKWIQELIRYIRPADDTLYIGEIKTIIDAGMKIIRDGRSSNREVTEAMKALQPYIKQEQLKIELELGNNASDSAGLITTLMSGIDAVIGHNKMIGSGGEIIDVQLLD